MSSLDLEKIREEISLERGDRSSGVNRVAEQTAAASRVLRDAGELLGSLSRFLDSWSALRDMRSKH